MTTTTSRLGDLVSQLDAPMVVVTTAANGRREGCLVGFHCQCSIEPALYAVWVSKANATYEVALQAEHFAVHRLRQGTDHDLAVLFGGSTGDDVDKFAGLDWTPGTGGVPLVARCPSRAVFRRRDTVDVGGDHVCLIGEPIECEVSGGESISMRASDVADITAGHPVPADGTTDRS
jgi:flavin reductase (DIM6/NTAB) family NADH-FMN oxidoreductase RutF